MGIQGLLPFLKDATHRINVRQYSGYTVAVDTYCWIHRGAFGCAMQLAKGEQTDMYVRYCLKFINMLLSMDIKPILVFDGSHLPAKRAVEESRRERRELYSKKGKQFLREGKVSEARDCFTKCINVTPAMALEVMKAARSLGVDCIVAPYEADAQLAYLAISGIAQAVITEDSDLVAFGCPRIIYKLDLNGNGLEIASSRLNQAMKIGDRFSPDKFRYMCIASGCDYLASLPGIGLGKAKKLFQHATNPDITHVLKRLPIHLKMKLTVPPEYIEGFLRADNTFLYQLAFDPIKCRLAPVHPYSADVDKDQLTYAGTYYSADIALQQALGNVDPNTKKQIFDFQPEYRKPYDKSVPRHKLSIWHKDYRPGPGFVEESQSEVRRPTTKGKEVELLVSGLRLTGQQRKRPRPDADEDTPTIEDLTSIYGSPQSKRHSSDQGLVVPETPESEDRVQGKASPRCRNPFSKEGLSSNSSTRSGMAFGAKERVIKTLTRRNIFAKGRTGSSARLDLLKSNTVVTSRFFMAPNLKMQEETAKPDESNLVKDSLSVNSPSPSVLETGDSLDETNEDDATSVTENTSSMIYSEVETGFEASALNKLQRFQRATSAPALPFSQSSKASSTSLTKETIRNHPSGSQELSRDSQPELESKSNQVSSQESFRTSVMTVTKSRTGAFSWTRRRASVATSTDERRKGTFRSLSDFRRQTATLKLESSNTHSQEGSNDAGSSQESMSQGSNSMSLESQESNLYSIDTDSLTLSQFSDQTSREENNSKMHFQQEINPSQVDQDDIVDTSGETPRQSNRFSGSAGREEHLRINHGHSCEDVSSSQKFDLDVVTDALGSTQNSDGDLQNQTENVRDTTSSERSESASPESQGKETASLLVHKEEEFIDLTSENVPPTQKPKPDTSTRKIKVKSSSDLGDTPTLPVFPKLQPDSTKLSQCKASGLSRRQRSKPTPKADENRVSGTRQQTLFAFMKKSSEQRKDPNSTLPLSPSKQNIICDVTPESDNSLCSKGIVRVQRNIFQ
ncbi:exonuclease 1-like [Acanthaster planci]|uniref:Exonuclease 1 n=1 Tax=Acanthaster planci TaxID=133434 RepID=A0A8B7YQX2_ACAPL|nr:exonuclease 1-like [Acanthaster planci]XP_022095680.1 exonuclease 1-like [Acanthaster planci]